MDAKAKLQKKFKEGFHICIGLDTDIKKIPSFLLSSKNPILEFNKIIIESTAMYAASYKLNFAFYEVNGSKGFDDIAQTLELIPQNVLTIADAKRGDIGNTSQMYAQSIFEQLKFDAVTLHPYMGFDSLSPFIQYSEKLNFILALTSNEGANDFEKLKLSDNKFLYQQIIETVDGWNTKSNCGIVFGATKLNELEENIHSFNSMPVLLPGVGAQGGSLEDVARTFSARKMDNYLVNISRALLYIDNSANLSHSVTKAIKDLNSSIKIYI
jgi:orotidine-5'-phosphate decarboxylase